MAVMLTFTATAKTKIYKIKVKNGEGKEISMKQYKGKVLLIVNTATRCGFTPQYDELEALYEKYHDQGLEILDFPCNQFFKQAPGTSEEIHDACVLRFMIAFPQFEKIDVNGKNEHPLYTYLKENAPKGKQGRIKWNFTKFLVNKDGVIVDRFGPAEKPESFEDKVAAIL